jgi:hypothetical protein
MHNNDILLSTTQVRRSVSVPALYATLLYSNSTLRYSTLLYSTLLYSTLLYSTLLYSYLGLLYSSVVSQPLTASAAALARCLA